MKKLNTDLAQALVSRVSSIQELLISASFLLEVTDKESFDFKLGRILGIAQETLQLSALIEAHLSKDEANNLELINLVKFLIQEGGDAKDLKKVLEKLGDFEASKVSEFQEEMNFNV